MKILKKLFNTSDTKIHIDEIALQIGGAPKLLSEAVIVESGSNANGKYIKYGDGTMICYKLNYYNMSINTDMELAFPAQFLGIDYVANVSPEGNSSIITSINGKGDSSIIVRSNTTNCTLDITIHGRWN